MSIQGTRHRNLTTQCLQKLPLLAKNAQARQTQHQRATTVNGKPSYLNYYCTSTNARNISRRNRTTQSCLNCHTSKRMVSGTYLAWRTTNCSHLYQCDRKRPACARCTQLGLVSVPRCFNVYSQLTLSSSRLAYVYTKSMTQVNARTLRTRVLGYSSE